MMRRFTALLLAVLHRQMIPWAMRSKVSVVHRPDNALNRSTTRVD